eukprot:3715575-Rhodomonas_salina.1
MPRGEKRRPHHPGTKRHQPDTPTDLPNTHRRDTQHKAHKDTGQDEDLGASRGHAELGGGEGLADLKDGDVFVGPALVGVHVHPVQRLDHQPLAREALVCYLRFHRRLRAVLRARQPHGGNTPEGSRMRVNHAEKE